MMKDLKKYGPKSVHAKSEDEADDYDSATDEDEPDEVDTNNERGIQHLFWMIFFDMM